MNISSIQQQQSKGLDTLPRVRLEGDKARDYSKSRTTQPVKRFNKKNTTYNKLLPYHCSTTKGITWVNNNSHTPYLGKPVHPTPSEHFVPSHWCSHSVPLQKPVAHLSQQPHWRCRRWLRPRELKGGKAKPVAPGLPHLLK